VIALHPITRRAFLEGTGAAALALALGRLRVEPHGAAAVEPAYRSWEDVYRERWRWDRVVKGTHLRANCVSACAWDLYVKDGVVWREEQAAVYGQTGDRLPDFNPRGCQKGACYSALMYGPARVTHPLRRVGARGSGRWKRISWDEALTEVADTFVDTCVVDGAECIVYDGGSTNVDFGPDTAAEMRLVNLLGATTLDSNGAAVGDTALGAVQTWGMSFVDGTADDWMHADHVLVWCMNPSYTRIPEAHFLWEARYRGSRVVVVTPDYNATAVHADLWLNPRVGSDAALALGLAHEIVAQGLYQTAYVKEQTDLPLLVRTDTNRLLREQDLRPDGREDVFYFWDARAERLAPAPGTQGDARATLALGEADPALDGERRVALRDGRTVTVRPVFTALRERLADYTPELVERLSGVGAEVIRRMAHDLARARTLLVLASFGACKHHHSDLVQRAVILLLALTGNQGKQGGGLRVAAWWSMAGFEELAAAYDPPLYVDLLSRWLTPSVRQLEGYITDISRQRYLMTPALLWLLVHGGLAELNPGTEDAVAEALRRGWMPVYPRPGQQPQVLLCTGGNPLRRWPAPQRVKEHLWPRLRCIVSVNFRMSATALASDIVLPAAAWYEKRGVKYAQTYLPYVVVGDRAAPPLGEAKSEWEIFGLLARRIQERARERGVGRYRDALGQEHDLAALYDLWSGQGRFPLEDEEKALDHILSRSEPTRGMRWAEAAAKGAVPIRAAGRYGPVSGVCSDVVPGETVAPSRWFVERKEPWPTLTGRQQFYLDHPWFLAAGEQLPCHKEPPGADTRFPLRLTGGHTRWSIHAIWRDEADLLRLQRGEPVAYLSVADAAARGVRDHEPIRIYNDTGSCEVRAKLSPAVQPGQVIVYHAWEPYQFKGWRSAQDPIASPVKALHLVGDYGQLHYRTGHAAPGYAPRATAVQVERVAEAAAG
jgi:DMSO reductase family type II enzyme molybdopterin subunit